MLERKAQHEQNREINKNAEQTSLFSRLFSSRTLKYGARSSHIMIGRKQEMIYNSNSFARVSCQMELPKVYVNDPVAYEMKKKEFREEVERSASGD